MPRLTNPLRRLPTPLAALCAGPLRRRPPRSPQDEAEARPAPPLVPAPSSAWQDERRDTAPPPPDTPTCVSGLKEIAASAPDLFSIVADRPGRSRVDPLDAPVAGARAALHVLLWVRRWHGDEAEATPALLQMAEYLGATAANGRSPRMLRRSRAHGAGCEPDGARRYQRRNAGHRSVNRDGAAAARAPRGAP